MTDPKPFTADELDALSHRGTAEEFAEAQSRLVAMAYRAIDIESRMAELERTLRYVEAERDVLMRCTNQPTNAVTEAARIEAELRETEERVAELESELATLREAAGLENRLFDVLDEREAMSGLQLRKFGVEPWTAVVCERDGTERVHESSSLPSLLRAILEVEGDSVSRP
jgi:predicted RNase H-like nuclease (RuvC/YqgF family)